eukprot:185675-Chlamydomonas_euryale.AAC.1
MHAVLSTSPDLLAGSVTRHTAIVASTEEQLLRRYLGTKSGGVTPLHVAAAHGHEKTVTYLLDI